MVWDNIPTIIFTDVNNVSYPVKDIRPFSNYQTLEKVNVNTDDSIDEIISRSKNYGDNNEGLSYALVENNIEILTEVDFDLTNARVRQLAIPVIND